jgi:hypothetical protein
MQKTINFGGKSKKFEKIDPNKGNIDIEDEL